VPFGGATAVPWVTLFGAQRGENLDVAEPAPVAPNLVPAGGRDQRFVIGSSA
jgi:hypothetical protein